jgi:hypothetical protein
MEEGSSGSPRDRAERAGERAARARERSLELATLDPSTREDVDAAQTALRKAHERAGIAARGGAATLRRSAERHDAVAEVLEAAGRTDRAVEHRRAATEDIREAHEDDARAQVHEREHDEMEQEP